LEYYQTLGGTPGGWDEARRGLEGLAQQSPDDPVVALALAEHLTYRESTRRQGIAQLARLAERAGVADTATRSWRRALVWSGTRPADIPLYEAFLKANPQDSAIETRLREVRAQQRQARVAAAVAVVPRDPLRQMATEAFKALDNGDLDAAESQFLQVLASRPSDADALGGMGILRLRQENFQEARGYLERASRGGSASRWKQALDSATYWSLVQEAQAARGAGDFAAARSLLERAIRLNPPEVTGRNDLGDTLIELGQYDEAEKAYRSVLDRQADNPDAIRGLVGVLAQNGKAAEALQLIEKLSPTQQDKVGALGRLRATQAMGQAKAATERGDFNAARLALEDALLNDPASPWVRLDLARLYLQMGATRDARGVMDGLLVSNPNMPEALYASALLAAEAQDWANSLATLERIPGERRTRDIAALQKRVWVHVQADTASALAAAGDVIQARNLLAQAEPFAAQDSELLGTIALAYADAGDPNRALGMVRQVLARTPRADVGLRLQYAATLLKTNQDVELAGILRQLQDAPMSAPERKSYADIRIAYVVRQAEALREAGNLPAAYDLLEPVLAERPGDASAIGALARMYAANQDYPQALALYNQLLAQSPNDVRILLPAANMAIEAKDYGKAESALQIALLRAPQDPEVLTTAGRLARAQGKTSQAGQFFAQAVAAEDRMQEAQIRVGRSGSAPASRNPFLRGNSSGTLVQTTPARMGVNMAPAMQPVQSFASMPAPAPSPPPSRLYIPEPAGASRFAAPAGMATSAIPRSNGPEAYYRDAAVSPLPTVAPRAQPQQQARPPVRGGGARSAVEPRTTTPDASKLTPAAAYRASSQSNPMPQALSAGAQPILPQNSATWDRTPTSPYQQQAVAYTAPAQPQSSAGASNPATWSSGGFSALDQARGQTQAPAPSIARLELRDIRESKATVFSVGTVARIRQGESGLGQISDLQAPVQVEFSVGDGRMTVGITPTAVSAGTPDQTYGTLNRFGAGPAAALAIPTRSPGSQNDAGVGLQLAYALDNLKVDIGTRPLGFRETDIVGGVQYRLPVNDRFSILGEISRRAVSDSVLSFAGARDARTGFTWGGVSATGGRLDATWDDGAYGVYGYGSLQGLTGKGVASNSRIEAGGGMYWRVHRAPDSSFTAGLNATGISYDKNLRYFTYGHGGYFSPQQFLSLSVPLEWTQRSSRLSYQIKGSLGVQYFQEDAAAYFPTSASRQAGAAQAASDAQAFGESNSASAVYGGQSKTGLGYSLGMAMEYQLHPQLFLGGSFALDNARDFREFKGGLYLRYALQPQSSVPAMPVRPLQSPY
jgi:tetratricopeptide (TPR) repeat protein